MESFSLSYFSALPFVLKFPPRVLISFPSENIKKVFLISSQILGLKVSEIITSGDGIFTLGNPEKLYQEFSFSGDNFLVEEGMKVSPNLLLDFLIRNGYFRVQYDPRELRDFSLVGDVFEVVLEKGRKVRVEFLFDVVEKIYLISDDKIEKLKDFSFPSFSSVLKVYPLDIFDEVLCFCSGSLCREHSKGKIFESALKLNFRVVEPREFIRSIDDLKDIAQKYDLIFVVRDLSEEQLARNLGIKKVVRFKSYPYGFIIPELKLALLHFDILSQKARREIKPKLPPLSYEELREGTYVVHKVHGIGIFRGTSIEYGREFLKIEYRDEAMLYIPAEDISYLHKYIGVDNPPLDAIGGRTFALRKERVKQFIESQISDFIRAIAIRKSIKRPPYKGAEEIVHRVKETFFFEETPDQLKAIDDIIEDLCEKDYPADRIILGDSGVGKTEVALRAAALVAYSGKQVAFICPTTPLALQHFMRFRERLYDFPFRIEMLSRLTPKYKEKEIIEGIRSGAVDIVIGTHKVLNVISRFKNLGLLIIDEEQRFGVSHKERISRIRATCDVISLTATPIPRTLKMALSGLKDISFIRTKPLSRGKIITSLVSKSKVKDIIEYEINRGGQVIYVYPYISGQDEILIGLKKMFPEEAITIIHGKMRPKEIENIVLAFMVGKVRILIATKIVALGIDIPSANTMIIDRADLFGLSELYQLRGRVGRGEKDAYCYLIIPEKLGEKAKRRLDIFLDAVNLDTSAVGFQISLKDLEMRGAGNLFGKEQVGHIYSVGFDVYLEVLQEVIEEMKGKLEDRKVYFEPKVEIDIPAFIPKELVPDPMIRLSFYRAFSTADDEQDVDEIKNIIIDRFSDGEDNSFPELDNFVKIAKLKAIMRRLGIFSAIFSKDLTFVEIESKEGKMKIPVSGIDELIEMLSKKASA
jgi:transcription-repair coupling factor (superfamily II helicase)